MTDKRPDPKPRKHSQLWQAYLWWDELMQMRKRHVLRRNAAIEGKTTMDPHYEAQIIEWVSQMECDAQKTMIALGEQAGPIWDWLVGIKGIGDHTAAKLIALIDYPGPTEHEPDNFATISQLWRFSGWAVIDGQAERNKKGEKSHFNGRLKSECYLVGQSFIKQQTPVYVDIYYAEKARLRREHPEPEPAPDSPWPEKYTDSHLHRMARRKMVKIFLSHLWLKWREFEGLPVTEPYIIAHDEKHEHMIEPPETVER